MSCASCRFLGPPSEFHSATIGISREDFVRLVRVPPPVPGHRSAHPPAVDSLRNLDRTIASLASRFSSSGPRAAIHNHPGHLVLPLLGTTLPPPQGAFHIR